MPRPVRATTVKLCPSLPKARTPRAAPAGPGPRAIRCASCGAGVRASPATFRRPWLIHVLPVEVAGGAEARVLQFVLHTDCRDLFPSLSSVDEFLRAKLREGGQGAVR